MENYLRYIICKELLKIFFIEFNVKLKKIGTFVRYIICSTKKWRILYGILYVRQKTTFLSC